MSVGREAHAASLCMSCMCAEETGADTDENVCEISSRKPGAVRCQALLHSSSGRSRVCERVCALCPPKQESLMNNSF